MMKEAHRELWWGWVLLILMTLEGVIGKWLEIDSMRLDKGGGWTWWGGFFGVLLVCKVVIDCAEAVIAALAERDVAQKP